MNMNNSQQQSEYNNMATQTRFENGAAFVDGQIVPIDQAKISMLDWGFLHSDATYDVVHTWNKKFFRLDKHLARFFSGMKALKMTIPFSKDEVIEILKSCLKATNLQNAYVEMICTRGVPPPGSRDPRDCVNRFYAFVIPFTWIANEKQREAGLRLYISDVERISRRSVDPRIKNYHWLDLVNGLFQAYETGNETAVLSDENGNVVEGPGFNIFAILGKKLVTPHTGVLEGVTRETVIELASTIGI